MDLNNDEVANSIRQLFPLGDFWDNQFADPESDLSIWCSVKSMEVVRFKERLNTLLSESVVVTAVETIADWERVAGIDNRQFGNETRRSILSRLGLGKIDINIISSLVKSYEAELISISRPYRTFSCRVSGCGPRFRLADFSALSRWIIKLDCLPGYRSLLEQQIGAVIPAHISPRFEYEVAN